LVAVVIIVVDTVVVVIVVHVVVVVIVVDAVQMIGFGGVGEENRLIDEHFGPDTDLCESGKPRPPPTALFFLGTISVSVSFYHVFFSSYKIVLKEMIQLRKKT
jgi:hypothetical protein